MHRHVVFSAILAALLCLDSCDKKGDETQAEIEKLAGDWVEVHGLAKEKTKGRAGYYVWVFLEGDRISRVHVHTQDGELKSASGHSGTYKLDIARSPKAIDIVLKTNIVLNSPHGNEEKYEGIYVFEADMLKLCVSTKKRPTVLESREDSRLFILKRPPKQ